MTHHDIGFTSGGVTCSAWHFRTPGDASRPVVVMAHGFGGTKDSGLQAFAEKLTGAGLDVFAFDYRCFGASEGFPRQSISIARQLEDYQSAIAAAKRLPNIDANRIVLWGSSLSGGHVLRVAAGRSDIVAVIALTPLTSWIATGRAVVKQSGLLNAVRSTVAGVRSRIALRRGKSPVLVPLVGRPGEPGMLTLDGAYESYLSIAGPTWRNEVDSAIGLELSKIKTKAYAKRLRCKLLVQIADFDRYVPADAIAKTAVYGRAVVHHYPCDHFDVWPGHDWFERVSDDQVAFLTRSLVSA